MVVVIMTIMVMDVKCVYEACNAANGNNGGERCAINGSSRIHPLMTKNTSVHRRASLSRGPISERSCDDAVAGAVVSFEEDSTGIDEVTSSCPELVKTERMVLKESMSDGDDEMRTARGTKASKMSMCERARRREDTTTFEAGGGTVFSSAFYNLAPHAENGFRSYVTV